MMQSVLGNLEEPELTNRVVRSTSRLHVLILDIFAKKKTYLKAFLTTDTNTNVGSLKLDGESSDVVTRLTWIIPTSFAPSPIARVMALSLFLTSLTHLK